MLRGLLPRRSTSWLCYKSKYAGTVQYGLVLIFSRLRIARALNRERGRRTVHPVWINARTPNGLSYHKTCGYHQIDRVIWHIEVPERPKLTSKVVVIAVNAICFHFRGVVSSTDVF
jgi:hypothetical protein